MQKKATLFSLTWPILIETFLFMLLGTVDIYMLSQYSDSAASAVGIANQVIGTSGLVFAIITSGTAIICAQYIGQQKNHHDMNKLIGAALQINSLMGIIVSIALVIFTEPLLKFMNMDLSLMSDGISYMRIVGGFVFGQAIANTFSAILRSHGKTKSCMIITIVMNLLNVGMNYTLIFGAGPIPSMGVKGAAISTTISRGIAIIALGVLLFRTIIKEFKLSYVIKFNYGEIKKILTLGIPSAGETISYNIARLFITRIITTIGIVATTANTYLCTITNYNYLFAVSIAQGTAILVGWKIGEGNKDEAYTLCLRSFKKGLIVSLAITFICFLGGKYILGLFTSNEEIIKLGVIIFALDIINEAGRCANLVIINSLRAAGDVRFPVFAGVFSMWGISVLLSYVFGIVFGWGFIGVWLAMGLDEAIRGIIMYIRWKNRHWEKHVIAK